eukprot:12929075-Alexandrium_andersonii.AAC.1
MGLRLGCSTARRRCCTSNCTGAAPAAAPAAAPPLHPRHPRQHQQQHQPVSYTHLTLPTICSV